METLDISSGNQYTVTCGWIKPAASLFLSGKNSIIPDFFNLER